MVTALLTGTVFLAAGFVQGLTGFGSALVAIPLLSLLMDVKTAVPLCTLSGMVITSYLGWQLRDHLHWHRIRPLLLGSIPGVLAGVTLLKKVDSDVIRSGIGVLLITYSTYNLLVRPRPVNPGRFWAILAGFLTGAIGAAFSAGGPPVIIYTSMTSWKKDVIKATLTGFFVLNGVVTVTVHATSGITTSTVLGYFAVAAPCVLAGTMLGSRVYGRIRRDTYIRLIYWFLIAMGIMLVAG
ncbi:hypothetical protein GF1_31930 [Desulfolithobacter dissulfuricans]|uniref:Probable membrane transporter protein n=1 Tax=Desulfolithobacter dissulfuricans TaxID=2795293 RepID=A0A915U4F7_9BACT|nr:sulfite exporter TauE/SafE family protein [Desulfolithobacter dissulfuricans]BCO10817.1 hypothetical protein GF1_31930 [Desulfolithobacter dissulfuricans]